MNPKIFLNADWQNLIMANYIVDPAILNSNLPNKTELDSWNGNTYVSLVGFMFMNTKVFNMRIPFHINFPEVNLRFYVRYKEQNEWKRGVMFTKEIVPKPAIAFVANHLFNEHYQSLPMKSNIVRTSSLFKVSYQWKTSTWNEISASTKSLPATINNGSEEEFITEHYWGYSKTSNFKASEYKVEHPRWKIYPLKDHTVHCNFKEVYGAKWEFLDNMQPSSVFMADGSKVSVFNNRILP